jgi:transcriptional regulator with PAS, ATPase and Fis domain
LITGETGTGKDLIAAAIHRQSARKTRPYVAVNMGAMAPALIASEIFGHERGAFTGAQDSRPGMFEQAHGGTVFLDEIATMDEKTQVSLLRVLKEKTVRRVGGAKKMGVDVRVIAASNEDLEKRVAMKAFREDLFYRLNVFHITVPPLRERPGAVTVLTDHFLSQYAAIYGKDVERVSHETYRLLTLPMAGQRARAQKRDSSGGVDGRCERAHARIPSGTDPRIEFERRKWVRLRLLDSCWRDSRFG